VVKAARVPLYCDFTSPYQRTFATTQIDLRTRSPLQEQELRRHSIHIILLVRERLPAVGTLDVVLRPGSCRSGVCGAAGTGPRWATK
jgi:hypothetical protein